MLTDLHNRPRDLPRIKPPEKPPVFVTAYLWKLLTHPIRWHPIFEQHAQRDPLRFQQQTGRRGRILQGIVAALWLLALIIFPQTVFALTMTSLALIPALLVLFNGTWLGVFWALTISSGIVTERIQGRYTLLSMTPRGALGISWLIATARLHRRNWFRDSHHVVRGLAIVTVPGLIFVIIMAAVSLLTRQNVLYNQQLTRSIIHTLTPVATGLILLWLDNIQSAMLACLTGMLVPSYLTDRIQVRLLTGSGFLSVQVFSYTGVAILALLLHAILNVLPVDDTLHLALLCGGVLCLFYLVREAVIGVMWRLLLHHFHADAGEFYTLARI